jgi:hypothetical protein
MMVMMMWLVRQGYLLRSEMPDGATTVVKTALSWP